MSQTKFPFDRQFQIGVLALCCQRLDFLLTATEVVKDEYFEDQVLIWFYQTIRDYYVQTQEQPTVHPVIVTEMKKALRAGRIKPNHLQAYTDVCDQLDKRVASQNYITNEIIRFCRRQAGRKAFLECAPVMDTATDEDWDDIIDKVTQAANIGTNYFDLGTHWWASAGERDRQRRQKDVKNLAGSTGIQQLDDWMSGGLRKGQMGIWMGGTGGGKSIALPQCGRNAISFGFNVVHYTLELNEHEIASRYDAAMTRINVNELEHASALFRKKIAKMGRYDERLIIKEFPTGGASVNTLRAHLKQLQAMDWYPDMIIVDYGDLLRPLTNYDNEYADLGGIFRDLRGLAVENRCPLWTATQVNRPGLSSEIIDVEHIGDSLKKAQIADIVIALCVTPEERRKALMRLYLAKNRNGPAKVQCRIFSAFEQMVLYSSLKARERGNPPPPGEKIDHLDDDPAMVARAAPPPPTNQNVAQQAQQTSSAPAPSLGAQQPPPKTVKRRRPPRSPAKT